MLGNLICYTKISQELKLINLVYCHALAVYNLYCLLYVQIVHQMNLSLQCDRSYMIISSFFSDLHFGNRHPLGAQEEGSPGVIKVPPHHPGQPLSLDYPAPWLYRPFTVLPGYLPLPSPLLINRFPGITGPCELKIL